MRIYRNPYIAYRPDDDGGSGDPPPGDGDDGGEPDPPPPPPAKNRANPHGFDERQQEAFNKAVAKERYNALGDLLSTFGVSSEEELKAKVAAARAAEQAQMTDLQKAQEKQTAAETRASTAESEAAQLKFERRLDDALLEAGFPAKRLGRGRGMVTGINPTSDDEAILVAVEELRDEFPDLFPDAEEGDPQGGDGSNGEGPRRSDPGRQPRQRNATQKNSAERAQSLLKDRHPELAK